MKEFKILFGFLLFSLPFTLFGQESMSDFQLLPKSSFVVQENAEGNFKIKINSQEKVGDLYKELEEATAYQSPK